MPVRNGAKVVRDALGDLVAGLSAHDEILVVDDGSVDATPQVLREFAERETRLRIIRTQGGGLVKALNIGLRETEHRWVARADADDRYPANRLSIQRSAIDRRTVLIAGDCVITAAGRSVGRIPCALNAPFVANSLAHPQRIPHPGVMIDKDAVLEAGGYREQDFPVEDLALWIRLASLGDLTGVPSTTVYWSMNPSSVTHTHQSRQRALSREILRGVPKGMFGQPISREAIEKELAAYEVCRLGHLRRILLARDLQSLRSMGGLGLARRMTTRSILRHPVETLEGVGELGLGKIKRLEVRKGMERS